jgi:hypothetical protein
LAIGNWQWLLTLIACQKLPDAQGFQRFNAWPFDYVQGLK